MDDRFPRSSRDSLTRVGEAVSTRIALRLKLGATSPEEIDFSDWHDEVRDAYGQALEGLIERDPAVALIVVAPMFLGLPAAAVISALPWVKETSADRASGEQAALRAAMDAAPTGAFATLALSLTSGKLVVSPFDPNHQHDPQLVEILCKEIPPRSLEESAFLEMLCDSSGVVSMNNFDPKTATARVDELVQHVLERWAESRLSPSFRLSMGDDGLALIRVRDIREDMQSLGLLQSRDAGREIQDIFRSMLEQIPDTDAESLTSSEIRDIQEIMQKMGISPRKKVANDAAAGADDAIRRPGISAESIEELLIGASPTSPLDVLETVDSQIQSLHGGRILPALQRYLNDVQQQVAQLPGGSYGSFEANKAFVDSLNAVLHRLGARLECSTCGRPAGLFIQQGTTKAGSFIFRHRTAGLRTHHGGKTSLPVLKLIPAPDSTRNDS